jgi:PAS domain S-box-containing protein
LSIALAALSGIGTGDFGDPGYWWRLTFVVFGTGLAIFASRRRCRAEAGARRAASAEAVAAVIEASTTAVITIDGDGTVTSFNDAAARLFGYAPADAIGRDVADLVIPEPLRDAHRTALARARERGASELSGSTLSLTALRADGSEFPVELALAAVPGPAPAFAGFVRDMTEVRRTELHQRLLSQSAELLDSSLDLSMTLDRVAHLPVPELAD